MKSPADILDAINRLERAFPVAAWRAGDAPLWPSYRMRLHGAAVGDLLNAQPEPRGPGRWRRLADRAARALWRVPLAAWRDRAADARARPGAAAVFLSDGVSFQQLGGSWFDRVVDPVIEGFEAQGLHALKLTPLAEAHVPRRLPSRFVQPAIDRVKLLAPLRGGPALDLPQFDALSEAAQRDFGAAVPTRAWLQTQAQRLDALARWFEPMLARSGAACAFVNTWYSLEGQAFVLAAHRRGLCAIDLQHGVQGALHAAYGRWDAMPRDGCATMPDEFWVWGAEEAAAIDAWSGALTRHRARITGNYWLERWLHDGDALVAQAVAQARALRDGAATQVLVGLSWGLGDEQTELLIEAARRCPASVRFLWRLHPVESARRDELAARLLRSGLDGRQVAAATDLPLYALLRAADMAMAHSSTVIQEAAAFGLPSVVTSDYGAALFAPLLHRGTVLRASDPAAIAAAISTLAARPRPAMAPAHAGATLDAAIDALLRSVATNRLQEATA